MSVVFSTHSSVKKQVKILLDGSWRQGYAQPPYHNMLCVGMKVIQHLVFGWQKFSRKKRRLSGWRVGCVACTSRSNAIRDGYLAKAPMWRGVGWIEGRSGLLVWCLWGFAPRPTRERGSLDPVRGEESVVFHTNDSVARNGANTGFFPRSDFYRGKAGSEVERWMEPRT